jgi:diamine N-acetyltransferase
LRDGRVATVRPLQASDVEPLGTFFLSLSERTRGYYGPHPFDRATAENLCASIDNTHTVRFVALLHDGEAAAEMIGYMILTREVWGDDLKRYAGKLDLEHSACLAPVIGDAYQEQGIGTQMGQHVIACARQMGLHQVILMGGVQARNERARRLYTRLGFKPMGEFWTYKPITLLNYDMLLDVA